MNEKLYKCPECGWVGTEEAMEADSVVINEDGDEAWSNWICPSCMTWFNLEDYEEVRSQYEKPKRN